MRYRPLCRRKKFTVQFHKCTQRRFSLCVLKNVAWKTASDKIHYNNAGSINFRFSPFIIIVNHFNCPPNALNYTKLRG
jgi:hypothetical protein